LAPLIAAETISCAGAYATDCLRMTAEEEQQIANLVSRCESKQVATQNFGEEVVRSEYASNQLWLTTANCNVI
jgi:hypothetical protein